MKKRVQERGEYDWSAEDLIELQSQPFELIEKIYSQFGDIVISGCAVTGNRIESGVVCLGGVAMPFDGAGGVTFPCYLVTEKRAVTGRYVDGLEKPISYDYKAVISAARPEDESFVTVQSMGVEKLLKRSSDAVDSDSSNTVATSKAVSTLNKKITELASQELPKSDRIDLEDSDTLATSMAVATLNEKIKPLAQATETVLGGIKAKPRTTETLEVAIDTESGKLFASSVIDDLPINTILQTTDVAGNIFGDKWLECNGGIVNLIDYPQLKVMQELTFNKIISTLDLPLSNIVYGNGIYLARYKSEIFRSFDGTNWIKTDSPLDRMNCFIHFMRYFNGIFFMGGYSGGVFTTLDGIKWTEVYPNGLSNSYCNIFSLVYGNGIYLISTGDNNANRIYTSTNGKDWIPRSYPIPSKFKLSVYGNGLFLSFPYENNCLTSVNGYDWITQIFPNNTKIENVVFGNEIFLLKCQNDIILTSTNGINWIQYLFPFGAIESYALIYENGIFIMSSSDGRLFYSVNGYDWIQKNNPFFNGDAINSITLGNEVFMATATNIPQIATSFLPNRLPLIQYSYIKALQ